MPKPQLKADPKTWRQYCETFEWTRRAILDSLNQDPVQSQATLQNIEELRAQLSHPDDTDLERIAIEEVVTCHLQAVNAGCQQQAITLRDETIGQAKYWDKVTDRAQWRLLRSMHMLTRLRKANLDIKMKLWKNRPLGTESLNYFKEIE